MFELDVRPPLFPPSNRFEILADPSVAPPDLTVRESVRAPLTGQHIRTRNSRGTREAKRRRDAMRKLARYDAQRLDEQFSHEIEALISRTMPTLEYLLPATPPVPSAVAPSRPTSTRQPFLVPSTSAVLIPSSPLLELSQQNLIMSKPCLPRLVPVFPVHTTSPPEVRPAPLQYPFDFDRFSQDDFVHLLAPQTPPSALNLPQRYTRNPWISVGPVYYNLSPLSELREIVKEELKGQETQLWRPRFDRRQSRFFPSRARSESKVKLPPTAYKSRFASDAIQSVVTAAQKPLSLSDSVKQGVENTKMAYESGVHSSAANLWNILISQPKAHACDDAHLQSLEGQQEFRPYANSLRAGHSELDNTELSYVHANSLVGLANKITTSLCTTEHAPMIDSAIDMPSLVDNSPPMVGMNELLIDTDMDNAPCSPDDKVAFATPSDGNAMSVSQLALASVHSDLPTTYDTASSSALSDKDDDKKSILDDSDAHFQSERELFTLPSPSSKSLDESSIDIAAFLKLGHATNCWCQDCEEVPELVDADRLTDDEDDWVVCTPLSDEDDSPVDEIEMALDRERVGAKIMRKGNRKQLEIDDFFPSLRKADSAQGLAVKTLKNENGYGQGGNGDWGFDDCDL